MERDAIQRMYDGEPYDFNSHAHVERDNISVDFSKEWKDFNSHAHVERDSSCAVVDIKPNISTHTLTWSVTHRPAL